ncbi:hypothetical protein GCM10009104_08710 [Marinobacterium maritimum]|uniref:Uncharacterized protein n=1 Tax=Marinobacterium maritimum TaxID=500162 RepID=A0ABP3T9J3_9GAMM
MYPGVPDDGFVASEDIPAEHAKVFQEPWKDKPLATTKEFDQAVTRLPSNGKSLVELIEEVSKR